MTVLLGSTLKVSLVVLAGLGVAALLRRRSAAARHWVIAASLLCALALPVVELVVPAWGVSFARSAAPRVGVSDRSSCRETAGCCGATTRTAATQPRRRPSGPAPRRTMFPARDARRGCSASASVSSCSSSA